MAAWVKDVVQTTTTATANAMTLAFGSTIAAGDHVVIVTVRDTGADTLASVSCTAAGAVVSLDVPVITGVGGGGGTAHSTAMASIYLPNGASATDTVTVTWTAAAGFGSISQYISEYSRIATASWTDVASTNAAGFSTALAAPATTPVAASADGVSVGFFWVAQNTTLTAVANSGTGGGTPTFRTVTNTTIGVVGIEDLATTSGLTYISKATAGTGTDYTAAQVLYKSLPNAFFPTIDIHPPLMKVVS